MNSVQAQVFDHERNAVYGDGRDIFQHKVDEDSSSSKISAVPIVALGLGGLIAGVIIGERIDRGGPLEFTTAEKSGAVLGAAVGVTVGYVLAKRKQSKHTMKVPPSKEL